MMRTTDHAGDAAGSPGSLRMELQRNVRAPAIARSAVSDQLLAMGIDGSLGQTIVLLVSEVVSNAVRHSAAPEEAAIGLEATITQQTVRVAVTDAGSGFTPRPRDPERLGEGYGLYLLEKASSRWGIARDAGTTVWFELER
ncbi:MAG: serine/threonine-protein kinase RsbW [Solirubrobacteraceae bacterium]|jgi:anti-sigma regulatory factor (Ser/Thr protein kinase)|nr:serine/threonine-protein kinase RsbW [Solirubrobacteraceae bacterium]